MANTTSNKSLTPSITSSCNHDRKSIEMEGKIANDIKKGDVGKSTDPPSLHDSNSSEVNGISEGNPFMCHISK